MKEKLIQEISNAMTDVLSIEQMVQLMVFCFNSK